MSAISPARYVLRHCQMSRSENECKQGADKCVSSAYSLFCDVADRSDHSHFACVLLSASGASSKESLTRLGFRSSFSSYRPCTNERTPDLILKFLQGMD